MTFATYAPLKKREMFGFTCLFLPGGKLWNLRPLQMLHGGREIKRNTGIVNYVNNLTAQIPHNVCDILVLLGYSVI